MKSLADIRLTARQEQILRDLDGNGGTLYLSVRTANAASLHSVKALQRLGMLNDFGRYGHGREQTITANGRAWLAAHPQAS